MSATARDKYPLNLPVSRKETTARLAKDDGVKIGAVETAEEFLARRAARAAPGDLLRYLDGAPHTPPAPGDEIPEA